MVVHKLKSLDEYTTAIGAEELVCLSLFFSSSMVFE